MKTKIALLIIDPQVDFARPAVGNPKDTNYTPAGALYIPGAEKDIERLATMIERNIEAIDDITITLDSHQPTHVAHGVFWVDRHGKNPDPFTQITVADVEGTDPKWRAAVPALKKRAIDYVKALEKGGRYVLTIWPPHCLIGTPGHCIMPRLNEALRRWQDRLRLVNFVTKGSNALTEHYSLVKADVVDPLDPGTQLNARLIEALQEADELLIAGEALSHCVANSVRDIAAEFGDDQIKKLTLLTDATTSVPGFEKMGDDFVAEMVKKGMKLAKTTNAFAR
jgi:nicotinamidase-related amidase